MIFNVFATFAALASAAMAANYVPATTVVNSATGVTQGLKYLVQGGNRALFVYPSPQPVQKGNSYNTQPVINASNVEFRMNNVNADGTLRPIYLLGFQLCNSNPATYSVMAKIEGKDCTAGCTATFNAAETADMKSSFYAAAITLDTPVVADYKNAATFKGDDYSFKFVNGAGKCGKFHALPYPKGAF